MATIKYDVKCPKCNTKNRIKVNDEIDSSKIMDIVTKEIFNFTCKKCNQSIIVEYPFKISSDSFVIYYTPTKNEEIKENYHEYMRICDTFDDLKEKLLIFNDNLNDIVIELIKSFLLRQMDEKIKEDATELRYNGLDEENLLFSLIETGKIIGCKKEFYENLKKKMKFKKNKKCILVDKYTYHKYFKMRLL